MDAPEPFPEPVEYPTDLRFVELRPEPWPEDNLRIRVHVQVTPFEQRPDIDLAIMNLQGEEIATVTIVEMLDPKFVITMHLRGPQTAGSFTLRGRLYFTGQEPLDEVTCSFELPSISSNLE